MIQHVPQKDTLTQSRLFTEVCIFCQKVFNLLFCAAGYAGTTELLHGFLQWDEITHGCTAAEYSQCCKTPQEESRLHCKLYLIKIHSCDDTKNKCWHIFTKYCLNFTLLGHIQLSFAEQSSFFRCLEVWKNHKYHCNLSQQITYWRVNTEIGSSVEQRLTQR